MSQTLPISFVNMAGPKKDDIVMTETVTLDGFQAVLQPGKYGYNLSAIVESDIIVDLMKIVPDSLSGDCRK